MSSEKLIHDGIMMWLKRNGIYYVHSTFGKRATMTKDAPDFIIVHAGRAILLEAKTANGRLTAGQTESFRKIRDLSGMVVHVVRSVEEAIGAIRDWLGIIPFGDENNLRGMSSASSTEGGEQAEEVAERAPSHSSQNLFIARVCGADYVCSGNPSPGGTFERVRRATAADLINIREKY